MSYGLPGCIEQHSRSGKTHYLSHSFAQDRLVTMYRTLFACTLFLSKRTTVETGMRIAKQLFTVGTKNLVFFLLHSKLDTCFPFAFALHLGCCAQTIVVRHRRPPASTHKTDLFTHRLQFGPFLVSLRHSQSLILLSKNVQHKTGNHENKTNIKKRFYKPLQKEFLPRS